MTGVIQEEVSISYKHLAMDKPEEQIMKTRHYAPFFVTVLLGTFLSIPPGVYSAGEHSGSETHQKRTGVVTKGSSGALDVKTADGASFQLNPNLAKRPGHVAPKEGDEVTFVLDENNTVIDMHPKGEEGSHKFVTGKLIYVGKMKNEIKLKTADGEQMFPLERLEVKTKPIPEGTMVTVELNEAGTVIDLHRADEGKKH